MSCPWSWPDGLVYSDPSAQSLPALKQITSPAYLQTYWGYTKLFHSDHWQKFRWPLIHHFGKDHWGLSTNWINFCLASSSPTKRHACPSHKYPISLGGDGGKWCQTLIENVDNIQSLSLVDEVNQVQPVFHKPTLAVWSLSCPMLATWWHSRWSAP